jgi:hypothetical protein
MRRLAAGLSVVVTTFAVVAGGGSLILANSSSALPSHGAPQHRVRVITFGPNLIDNPGFSHGREGWIASKSATAYGRIVAPGLGGNGRAIRLSTQRGGVAHVLDRRHGDVAALRGQRYQARVHVRTNEPGSTVVLRVRQWHDGRLSGVDRVRVHLNSRKWRVVSVPMRVICAHARLQVGVVAPRLMGSRHIVVDKVMLRRMHVRFLTIGGSDPSPTATDPGSPTPDPTSASPTPDPTSASPTPDPTTHSPTPSPTPPAGGSSTLFGASVYQNGLTWPDALTRSNGWYGGMDVVRVYYTGMPDQWPGRAGSVGGPISVSFKDSPARVLSGQDDAFFKNWFASAPRDRQIWWTYWHEPEDDIEAGRFTAADYRAAWAHLADLANQAGNPNLHATLILMCWTLNPASHRNFADYFPGTGTIDVLGWDCYNRSADKGVYTDPGTVFGPLVAKSNEVGLPFAIGEFGSVLAPGDNGSGRAQWLSDCASYLSRQNAVFVTYFDSVIGADYRLLDTPSRTMWRSVVTG